MKLSSLPGVLIQDVAAALDIHPFMLSLWRKQVRDGVIVAKSAKLDVQTTAELKRLRDDAAKGKLRQIRHHFWCPFLVRRSGDCNEAFATDQSVCFLCHPDRMCQHH